MVDRRPRQRSRQQRRRLSLRRCRHPADRFQVGWTDPGDWLEYDIVVTQTGLYRVTAHVTSGCCGNLESFHLDIDGSDASGPVEFELIDDWDTLHDVVGDGIYLEAGPHRLRFVWDEVPFDLESFDLTLP